MADEPVVRMSPDCSFQAVERSKDWKSWRTKEPFVAASFLLNIG
jgi:hypothetical protein